ncbi:MAG: hypothetical protein A2W00_04705 [Candidatus Eisenbacteria bacterium RBG_16_71_46]|nr:MAG: hypothetical protein A2W00_04705 [Candidatus Eisenbacteria bacterium RBG_16_71_46]
MSTYQRKIYHEQGGDRQVVAAGGSIDVESGGELDVESGGALKLAGTQVTATADEINKSGGVTAGTVAAGKAVVVDADKDIGDFRDLDAVNIDAGASGVAGSVDVFPATEAKGKLTLACANQTGDTVVTLLADAMGQATTVHVPDPGAAASYVAQSSAALSRAEVDVLDGVTAGQAAAGKAVVLGASKEIDELHTAALSLGAGAGTVVTATAAQLNALTGNLATLDAAVTRAMRHTRVGERYRPVADKCYLQKYSQITGQTSAIYRTRHKAITPYYSPRVIIANYGNNVGAGEVAPGNAISVKCSIEYPVGTVIPLYVSGARPTSLGTTDLTGWMITDPDEDIYIAAGEYFYVRTYVLVGGGEVWQTNAGILTGGPDYYQYGVDYCDTTDIPANQGVGGIFPSAILGNTGGQVLIPSWAIVGDSIPGMYIGRGLADTLAYVNCGNTGERAQYYALRANRLLRSMISEVCSHLLLWYGYNDLNNSRTLAQLQADCQTIANLYKARGVEVYLASLLPATTSTDSWATLENQSDKWSGTITQRWRDFNTWVRTTPTPFDGYWDPNLVVDNAQDSNRWKVTGGAWTDDGVHPKHSAPDNGGDALRAAIASWAAGIAL